ncbi:hypothetical protein HYH03_008344 [Edaphochlamys debaryana]|uniref:RAB6-interacting golgin n=1 Tax=Edaphochlamys debaryana TaxID=47281 RepID=A0A835Y0K4_9CHLO|nr:hypothetical protein HYH03_008344 [Edaphochlamys debaryana]|eukprot:KAG2493530.1 hypothetical protein HYH03_008344 [Edaphochlamys debaryana]
MYHYSQKAIEQKEKELMESIARNYGRIREVERELSNLQLQLKLTAGPKKQALEMLRKKIETQNEKVVAVRAKHTAAKATYERLDAELKKEEAVKDQLCDELNMLVQQAARAQMDKLEELKTHLEALYSGGGTHAQQQAAGPHGAAPGAAQQASAQGGDAGPSGQAAAAQEEEQRKQQEEAERQRQEAERQKREEDERQKQEAEERRRREAAEAEAAAARSRHVSLNPGPAAAPAQRTANGAAGPGGRAPAAGPGRPRPAQGQAAPARSAAGGQFLGFDT